MGRIVTPKYRVDYWDNSGKHSGAWIVSDDGKPNDSNLEKWVMSLVRSYSAGGVNSHISASLGYVPFVTMARIVNQKSENVITIWHAAMFQVYN